MRKLLPIFLMVAALFAICPVFAQSKKDSSVANDKQQIKDSIVAKQKQPKVVDTTVNKGAFNPRIATKRSAILPGWGQIYNKKYWKLPLVYGALGITAGVFVYNIKTYKILKQAYAYKVSGDTNLIKLIDKNYQKYSIDALRVGRNGYRQNVDYSVLFFIIFWGVNVIDATVDAQFKVFDVNDNISMNFNPGHSSMANTTGLSLVFDIHSKKLK